MVSSPHFGYCLTKIPSVLGIPFSYCMILVLIGYPPGITGTLKISVSFSEEDSRTVIQWKHEERTSSRSTTDIPVTRWNYFISYTSLACENIRFSSLFVAEDVSRGGTSATQRQKFHTDDANQCLHNKSGSHGVPNINLSNFACLLVDFGKVLCWCAHELQQNSNASSWEDYVPQNLWNIVFSRNKTVNI